MSFSFRNGVIFGTFLLITLPALSSQRELRVCADPNNLPFSNMRQQGFENQIARIVARDLHSHLKYQWQRMGRGFVREYLDKSYCDLLIGVPSQFRPVLTTIPYYRSTYVFVTRQDHQTKPASLNDPLLHQMKIGVQVLEEDYTPPATALARRGMQAEIVGFETMGADADSIIRGVAERKVDTAIVWGPLAGYFARNYGKILQITPVTPEVDPPGLPFTFAISMGVRKQDTSLRDDLNLVLQRRRTQIEQILQEYGVPQLEMAPPVQVAN